MATLSSSAPSDQGTSSSDLLRGARFNAGAASGDIQAPTSSQLLGDAAALHPLANLNKGELDYLLLDDGKLNDIAGGQTVLPSRGWADELCYGTGTTYLAGLGAGGLWGLREGLVRSRRMPGARRNATLNNVAQQASEAASKAASALGANAEKAASAVASAAKPSPAMSSKVESSAAPAGTTAARAPPFRVRLNAVLNSITRRGTFVGNNAGVLALIYNAFNSSLDKCRGKHDIYGSMLAGASTGLLWKSTAGLRPMFIASVGMTAGAAAWTLAKPALL